MINIKYIITNLNQKSRDKSNCKINPKNVSGYIIKIKHKSYTKSYICINSIDEISSLKFKSRMNIQSLNFKSMIHRNLLYYRKKKENIK